MKNFMKKNVQEMTVGDTIKFTAVMTVICGLISAAFYGVCWLVAEWRNIRDWAKEKYIVIFHKDETKIK